MGSPLMPHVRSANALTARWCATFGGEDTVVSAAGVWPLLAILAGCAEGPTRAELVAAAGVPAEYAHAAGLELLKTLDASREVTTAIGAWVRPELPLREEWVRSMPAGTVGTLRGSAQLDAWARDHTDGLIEKFPVPITERTLFALATALLARTRWAKQFDEVLFTPETGPWQGHRGPGLYRRSYPDGSVSVLDDTVTRVVVRGRGELDVHLLISADGPARALDAGLAALDGALAVRTDPAPGTVALCLAVERREVFGGDAVYLTLPPFEVRAKHDLFARAALFGLTAARDTTRGHFPGLAVQPVALDAAAQEVVARFDAAGFEAAAVSAVAMTPGGVPQPTMSTITSVRIDRPFGFLAVDRPTGLVLVAGQVTRPPREWSRPAEIDGPGRMPGVLG
ncbi:serpin family protein [Nocardia sp. AG03]|uniref:serpin family protein n=1 Tax=Nocardia sp. AG03 TaxID=3025312 RepID=UPI0024184D4B|nr:serpin family protein [Nocardia sp. AG03]